MFLQISSIVLLQSLSCFLLLFSFHDITKDSFQYNLYGRWSQQRIYTSGKKFLNTLKTLLSAKFSDYC